MISCQRDQNMTKCPELRDTDADLANTATDFTMTGHIMGKLRTANKRHKREQLRLTAPKKLEQEVPLVTSQPAKVGG